MTPAPSISIVEDESIVALDLKLQLGELGYLIAGIAASGPQALRLVAQRTPDLILMDVRLQGADDGIEVAAAIRREHDIPVIFLTSHSDDDTVRRAAQTAPYGYLTKPYQLRELRAGIEVALTKARLERQLREADRWFASTLKCVADGVIVMAEDARIRFMNPAAEHMTGWTQDESVGRHVDDVVHVRPSGTEGAMPRSRYEPSTMVRTALDLGRPTPVTHSLELASRSGAATLIDESVGPVADDDGRPLGAVLVLRDASQRVAQEALLRGSEERFRSAFDHAPLGMALVALTGAVLQVNEAFCRMLGVTAASLLQLDHGGLIDEADREHEAQRLLELMTGARPVVQYERRYRLVGRSEPLFTLVSVSLLHEDGLPTCYLFQVHDLTEQKAAAERLAELAGERMRREASELASAAKSQFLSRVSHEMRTPLNAVIGFASLLQMQAEQGATGAGNAGAYAHHIRAAGEHLLAMVTDLLDLNRATEGTLRLHPQPLGVAAAADEVLKMLEPLARSHGISIRADIDPALRVTADPVRWRQVLINVVSNAVKYNRQGGQVRLRAEPCAEGRVSLRVEDTGIGMTAEQRERLFQPFDRLGREATQTPGTGLGLVISQGLMAQMQGALQVDSEPRIGTTVHLELPA